MNEVAEFNPKSDLPELFEYVDLESVVGTEMVSHRTETKETAPSRAQRLAQTGDVFFQTVRPYQRNNYLFTKPDNNYVFSTGYAHMRPKIDAEFLMCFLQTDSFVKVVLDNCTGTSYPAINSNDLSNLEIDLPTSEDEQRRIGCLITNLDHLITLHQRKCDEIKTLKKYMLQKMFPEKGKRVPEIRFDGFTEDWEQRKLGELYTERNERGNDSLQILSVSIHSGVSDGELNEESLGKIVRRSKDKAKYKRVYSGDLIFNMMRAWQGAIGVAKTEGMVSPAYISAIPNEVIYPEFMNYLLRRKVIIGQINNLSYGVTDFRKRLYWNSFSKVMCQVPSTEEQKNIGEFFSKLDHLITLHQHKCEELQKLKKFMLQNMFV